MADDDFAQLSVRLQKQIDSAFDKITLKGRSKSSGTSEPRPSKRRKVEKSSSNRTPGGFVVDEADAGTASAGGFIVEDEGGEKDGGGGFLNEEEGSSSSTPTHIPLSLIPEALQILDLSPQDEDVLQIFKNAASGWRGSAIMEDGAQEQGVSRNDWRAVCAVLMADREDEGGDVSSAFDEAEEPLLEEENELGDGDESDDEEYDEPEELSSDQEDEDDDFNPQASTSRARPSAKTRRKERSSPTSSFSDDETLRMTARQKKESKKAFGLFFPGVEEDKLPSKRIAIKDIARVAGLLKEKLSVEDIVEMLEMFSTSPDKTVGPEDFEKIMAATRLV